MPRNIRSSRRHEAERAAADLLLTTSEEQFRLVFEAAPIGMALVGLDGRFLRVNPALCDLVGYPAADLIQATFQDITHPDDLDLDLELLQECLDGVRDEYEMEKRYFHRQGHEVWVSLHVAVARDADGRPTGFVSQILDIGERRAAKESLAASEARFAALVEHGSDLIAISDPVGNLLYASPAYGTLLGWDIDARLNQPLQDHVHPDDWPTVLAVGAALTGEPGSSATLDFRYAHADSSWRWMEATLTNRVDDPAVQGFVINTRDITDRVLAAELLTYRATHDALTGLPNRSELPERLAQAEAAAARRGEVVAALFVDIDRFKAVNDTYGHATGDQMLTAVAHRLRGAARVEDLAFRLGGDEFVLVAAVRDEEAATELAARVCAAFREPFVLEDRVVAASASVGVATTAAALDGVGLVEAADLALYDAKAAGRDRWVSYRARGRREVRGGASARAQVEDRYRAQVASSAEAILVHVDGTVVAVSAPAVDLLEAGTAAALVGSAAGDLIGPASQEAALARHAVIEAGSWPGTEELELRTRAGNLLRVEVASTPVFWDGDLATQITFRCPPIAAAPARRSGGDLAGAYEPDAELLDELAAAIGHDQLVLAYQPIVDQARGVVKVEALVRWQHPVRGLLLPGEFIPATERSSLIGPLTAEVLRRSCAQAAEWRRDAMPDLELAVNISGRELSDPGLVERVRDALVASGLPPAALWLEVTETALSEQPGRVTDRLAEICELGVGIALDDFGTGFATLAQLQQFPGHALKVDRMFVDGLVTGERGATAIVRSVLALGHELGLQVVAEGVETEEQRQVLLGMGCTRFQGYLFARPCFPDPEPRWVRSALSSGAAVVGARR